MNRYKVDDPGYSVEDIKGDDAQPDESTQTPDEDLDNVPPEVDGQPLDQTKVQELIDEKFAQWNRRNERKMRKQFGTSNLDEVAGYYNAGKAVSDSAGTTPDEVVNRLSQSGRLSGGFQPASRQKSTFGGGQPQAPQPNPAVPNDAVLQELRELRNMFLTQEQQKAREVEEKDAKKEFGRLYEQHEMEIEDYAEDHDLPLTDAAAVILRPRLADYYEERARTRKETQRARRVESGGGSTSSSGDDAAINYKAALGPELCRIAERTGMGYKKLYESRKAAGKLEE